MITDGKIRHEKLKFSINIGQEKISALSSRKIDKYDCHTRQVILSCNSIV